MAVAFSKDAAKRIAATVRKVEGMPGTDGLGLGDHQAAYGVHLCKTTAKWTKGTEATLDLYNKKTRAATTRTLKAFNAFADVEAGRWVAVSGGLLIAAECT